MQSTVDIVHQLARHGRVRQLADGATIADVARRMKGTDAQGLLYDGAGWDAARIAAELGSNPRQVHIDVARARLTEVSAECQPCSGHLDGLMTFSAESIDHSMTCAECKATRKALREGKLALRDRWSRVMTPDVTEVRHDRQPARRRSHEPARRSGGAVSLSSPSRAVVPTVDPVVEPAPAPSPVRSTTRGDDTATVDPADDPWPDLHLGEPRTSSSAIDPPAGRPEGRIVSLPDRSPGRSRLTGTEIPAPDTNPGVLRRLRSLPVMLLATFAHLLGGRDRRPSGRRLLGLVVTVGALGALGWAVQTGGGSRMVTVAVEERTTGAAPATPVPADARPSSSPRPVTLTAGPTADLDPTPSPRPTPTPTSTPTPTPRRVAVAPPAPEEPGGPTLETWQALAQCESSGDWGIDSGNGFYGGLQFTLDSWRLVGGSGYPHQHTAWEQIHRAERLLDMQGWVAWPVCSVELGLR